MPSLNSFRLIDPVDQAEVLLTACEDDVRAAFEQAASNFQNARTEAESIHWFGVLQALTPSTLQN
jgi:hypothetical protein